MKRLVRTIANHLVNPDIAIGRYFERGTDIVHYVDCLDLIEHLEHLKLSFVVGNSFFHAILYMHFPCHSGKIFFA